MFHNHSLLFQCIYGPSKFNMMTFRETDRERAMTKRLDGHGISVSLYATDNLGACIYVVDPQVHRSRGAGAAVSC